MAHKPAEGALHDPAARQDFEAADLIGALHHFHFEFWPKACNPSGKCFSAIASVDPQQAQPAEPAQSALQHPLPADALRRAGGGHEDAQDQPQSIDESK